MCPACLPVCLCFYLIIVRLIISACDWSIITIKTITGEECCAWGGESVFTNHLIGAHFVVCFKEPQLLVQIPEQSIILKNEFDFGLDVAAALGLRVVGGSFVWIFPCFAEIDLCARHFWRLLFISPPLSLSLSVCRLACFLVRWCTSAPTLRQVFVFSVLFFHMLIWIRYWCITEECNITEQ